jgi:hypothetical protein
MKRDFKIGDILFIKNSIDCCLWTQNADNMNIVSLFNEGDIALIIHVFWNYDVPWAQVMTRYGLGEIQFIPRYFSYNA